MARKFYCENKGCKFHRAKDTCASEKIRIGTYGCYSFEKGFIYYFQEVWKALEHSNMIPYENLTEDLKIGIYYVCEIWNLGFLMREHGYWRWISLCKEDEKVGLTYKEIIELDFNEKRMMELYSDFEKGILPGSALNKETSKPKKESQPFGWLSPTGDFIEGDFAEHENVAERIIEEKGFGEDYNSCLLNGKEIILCRDYLTEKKGYCLIHDPSGVGRYIVSHVKPFTKKQKEFLYRYFIDMGDVFAAEKYLDNDI